MLRATRVKEQQSKQPALVKKQGNTTYVSQFSLLAINIQYSLICMLNYLPSFFVNMLHHGYTYSCAAPHCVNASDCLLSKHSPTAFLQQFFFFKMVQPINASLIPHQYS